MFKRVYLSCVCVTLMTAYNSSNCKKLCHSTLQGSRAKEIQFQFPFYDLGALKFLDLYVKVYGDHEHLSVHTRLPVDSIAV